MINNNLKDKAMIEVCTDLRGNIEDLSLLASEHQKKYRQYMDSLRIGQQEEKELLNAELGLIKELIVKSVLDEYACND